MECEQLLLKIETLTPIHISDGALGELTPLDYVVEDKNMLHVIDFPAFVKALNAQERNDFTTVAQSDSFHDICMFIRQILQSTPERLNSTVAWSTAAGDLSDLYDMLIQNLESRFFLKPFIRSAGSPYLPGSSLKGSLRTALIAGFLGPNGIAKFLKSDPALVEAYLMESRSKNKWGRWFADTIKDPLKALKTSDAYFVEATTTTKQVVNVRLSRKGGIENEERSEIKNFAECIGPGAIAHTNLALDKRFFEFKHHVGRSFSLKNVVEACKAFYDKLLKHEKKFFFDGFSAHDPDSDIADFYDRLSEINQQPNCFLLRVGRFAGRNSTSLNIYNLKGEKPQSRSLVRHQGVYRPLGWAKVTFE